MPGHELQVNALCKAVHVAWKIGRAAQRGVARHPHLTSNSSSPWQGYYFTGDGCRRDKDGMITITGRVDDVINVSGHRIGTAEVESALAEHEDCAEAACVG